MRIKLTLPDGSVRAFDQPVSGAELARDIAPSLAKAALACASTAKLVDLATVIDRDARVAIVTATDPDALELIRHDAAHVLAEAVQELYPGTQVTIGPAIENGFYYDFARDEPFTPDDLPRIEERMREIVDRDGRSAARSGTATRRSRYFEGIGENYKAELIADLPDRRGDQRLPAGRLARPVPRPAPAVHRQAAEGLQADQAGRRLLARRCPQRACCSASTAPPGPRRSSSTPI